MENSETKGLIIYGKQPVYEALRSDHLINKIIIAREIDTKDLQKISSLADKKKINIILEKKANLQKICGPVLHQGIVAILDEFNYVNEKEIMNKINISENPFVLILDQIQDPHNLGAIIRTAEIAGITAIILPEKGSASVNATVAKTSVGAVFHCLIHRSINLREMITKLNQNNIRIYAMVPQRKQTIFTTDLRGAVGIIIGSEGKGVRKNIQLLCDAVISIPTMGKTNSLNASVAAAVVIFEAFRQRQYGS